MMEIRPILLSLKQNKAVAILIIIQVALTLAVLSISVLMTTSTLKEWNLPSGIPHENIVSVIPEFYDPEVDIRQSVSDDLERIKGLSGVIGIAPVSERPFDARVVSQVYLQANEDAQAFSTNIFNGNVDLAKVLDLELLEGRFFNENDVLKGESSDLVGGVSVVMISKEMSEALFPDSTAIGQTLWLAKGEQPAEVIGIYSNFMNGERLNFAGQSYRTVMRPLVSWQRNNSPNYLIRVEPGMATSMLESIRTEFYKTDGRYVNQVEVLTRTQKRMYDGRGSRALQLLVISLVLLLITAFGMAGLVSFLVTQRQKQIGTRRALGAKKWQVVRYFMLENGIVSLIGITLGLIITLSLVLLLTDESGMELLDMGYIIATALFILLVNQIAVYLPAKRAANIEPAIVTKAG
jgi:putative ABC transport system permease protein